MREIKPSQFIEAILESQQMNSVSIMELKVRTFNKMVDQLHDLNLRVQFGFSDLVEFAEVFEDVLSYKDFAIHISYTKPLLDEVKKYNQIYASVRNIVEINDVWKKLVK